MKFEGCAMWSVHDHCPQSYCCYPDKPVLIIAVLEQTYSYLFGSSSTFPSLLLKAQEDCNCIEIVGQLTSKTMWD